MLAKRVKKGRIIPLSEFYGMLGLAGERKAMAQGFSSGHEKFIEAFRGYSRKDPASVQEQ